MLRIGVGVDDVVDMIWLYESAGIFLGLPETVENF